MTIEEYNKLQTGEFKLICEKLYIIISNNLNTEKLESKIWHKGPVWFIDGNPVVGYWVRKNNVQLLFWSGQDFKEEKLKPEGKFKASEYKYINTNEIIEDDIKRWLQKCIKIQWDYKNIVKRKGVLIKL